MSVVRTPLMELVHVFVMLRTMTDPLSNIPAQFALRSVMTALQVRKRTFQTVILAIIKRWSRQVLMRFACHHVPLALLMILAYAKSLLLMQELFRIILISHSNSLRMMDQQDQALILQLQLQMLK
jgi:hypothetical protein